MDRYSWHVLAILAGSSEPTTDFVDLNICLICNCIEPSKDSCKCHPKYVFWRPQCLIQYDLMAEIHACVAYLRRHRWWLARRRTHRVAAMCAPKMIWVENSLQIGENMARLIRCTVASTRKAQPLMPSVSNMIHSVFSKCGVSIFLGVQIWSFEVFQNTPCNFWNFIPSASMLGHLRVNITTNYPTFRCVRFVKGINKTHTCTLACPNRLHMVKTKVSDSSGVQACPDSTTWKELTHQPLDKSELNSSIAHTHIFQPHCALRYIQSRSIG